MDISVEYTTRSIRGVLLGLLSIGLVAVLGCDEQFAAPVVPEVENAEPEAAKNEPVPAKNEPVAGKKEIAAKKDEQEGCRVSGRIVSTAWRGQGGRIERAIVSAWKLPQSVQIAEDYHAGEEFEIGLPPGRYRLVCSAVGTRGATFEILNREIVVPEGQDHVDLDPVDLPISKSTALYGQPAPELDGIVAWQDTPPIALKDLKGKGRRVGLFRLLLLDLPCSQAGLGEAA